jgi:hypothetical protein
VNHAYTTALISVNGSVESVSVGKTFPASSPTFTLVSVSRNRATIGIAGGSLENGASALQLRVGKPVTLQNTADQSTYVIKLLGTS